MSVESPHPKGALVVPEKVVFAFQKDLLPKQDVSASLTKPETLKGKAKYFYRKSSIIVGPPAVLGATGGMAFVMTSLPYPGVGPAMALVLGTLWASLWGVNNTLRGVVSIIEGDHTYTPLPPTQEYLERQKSKQAPAILPFEAWDNTFSKNHSGKK